MAAELSITHKVVDGFFVLIWWDLEDKINIK
jgi:hypothetical protein